MTDAILMAVAQLFADNVAAGPTQISEGVAAVGVQLHPLEPLTSP